MRRYITIIALILSFFSIQAARAQGSSFSVDLKVGDQGQHVSELQSWLLSKGYRIASISSGTTVKGYFGTETKMAVAEYQRSLGLPATGYLGSLTRARINAEIAGKSSQPAAKSALTASVIEAIAPTPEPVKELELPAPTVSAPNGQESWQRGTLHNIAWKQEGDKEDDAAVDIKLIPDSSKDASSSSTIAADIKASRGSYPWQVGNTLPAGSEQSTQYQVPVSDGRYRVAVCRSDTSDCDTSDDIFTIYSLAGAQAPVIGWVDGPTSISANKPNTWTVHAYDPGNQALSYVITWGDGTTYALSTSSPTGEGYEKGIPFTHTYTDPDTYTPFFRVRNASGVVTDNSMRVFVNYPSISLSR